MTTRTPKLDPEWMKALGFRLIDTPRISMLQWQLPGGHMIRDDTSLVEVIKRRDDVMEFNILREQQAKLRDVLLPAMGLELREEYAGEEGYTPTGQWYVRGDQ